ncbi:MAG: complex I subunit 1 family protein [Campylobacterota bacterium]|nr:complex I subunit 1 family protein [Campylobacterota bacterium]
MSLEMILVSVVNNIVIVILALAMIPVMVWWERRIAGFIQDRSGPNRSNIFGIRLGGLVQGVADMLKLFFKENLTPAHIKEKKLFVFAPVILFICSFLTFGVIPLADDLVLGTQTFVMQAVPVDVGILWFLAFAGLSVYGIILGGYASGNKYAILGSIRASAQTISYELAMGLAVVSMILSYNTINLNDMVVAQGELIFGIFPSWGILIQPLAAVIFIVTCFAETNRAPFDVAEGESEIVAGYHTEYSAMGFGLFQVGEYIALSASSALIVTIFFGGYQIPWMDTATIKENIEIMLFAVMLVVPVILYFFIGWIKKNNVWPNEDDIRFGETKILVKLFSIIGFLVVAIIGAMLVIGIEQIGTNISTAIFQFFAFFVKFLMMNFVFVWVRWTLLRFRYDQIQKLGWEVLLPLALLNIFITAIVVVW